ncbi:MAG: 5'-methylthioadenosine/S-adenosylhomocysteine nucleosidase [Thermotogaceae bacterium]|nr:5'-methylthioadenosine/S-adenosylhomocysteine nucleosidase [Thermotogaceae bacterium]
MILVLGVFEIEIDPIRRQLQLLETGELLNRPFFRGVIGPNEVVVTYGLVGKVESAMITQAFIDRFHPKAVLFTGAAGALSTLLHPGDVVVGDEYFEYDLGRRDGKVEVIEGSVRLIEKIEEHIRGVFIGRIATGDSFVNADEMREKIRKITKSIAVDMDSAAIAKVCKENEIDFVSIKTITNRCNVEEFQQNYQKYAGKSAALLLGIIDHHFIE